MVSLTQRRALRRKTFAAAVISVVAVLIAGCSGDESGGVGGAAAVTAANLAACTNDADCALFDDGDVCTGVVRCTAGRCALDAASVVVCDDAADTLCAASRCAAATGVCALKARNDGAACEDGDPCTIGDACKAGSCAAGLADACGCRADVDCKGANGGDVCLGTAYCDTSRWPYVCAVVAASAVVCAQDLGPCAMSFCDPAKGSCVAQAKVDGAECDDGDACTAGDGCKAGLCSGGATNICTCAKDADCSDDGDACNGVPYCDKGGGENGGKAVCKANPATVVQCPASAGVACQAFACAPATGLCVKVAIDQGKGCDDGDACSKGEVCGGGLCGGGADVCACAKNADCVDDGDVCNGTAFCNLASGKCESNPATKVVCASVDDTGCSKNACVPATGACAKLPIENAVKICDLDAGDGDAKACRWAQKPAGAPAGAPVLCDDGDSCTASDTCKAGACSSGTFVCTCQSDDNCLGKDDGDLCNGVPYCDKVAAGGPTCKVNPATVVSCKSVDDSACLVAQCQPKTGKCQLTPLATGLACDDGEPCTKADFCSAGQCIAGAQTCECQQNSDCLKKDDGDLCNGVPYCDKSDPAKPACKPNLASTVFCPPSQQPCLQSGCNPASGQCQVKPTAGGEGCDDGDACTADTSCKNGVCSAKTTTNCDDKDACTTDVCDKTLGCVHTVANCKDGLSCTKDVCDTKTGACSFDGAALDNTACDADGSGCTINDLCSKGVCIAGAKVSCTLPTKACEVAVCAPKGNASFECVVTPAPLGSACDDGDSCTLGDACADGVCSGGKASAWTSLSIKPPADAGLLAYAATTAAGGHWLLGQTWKSANADARATWLVHRSVAGEVTVNTALDSAYGSGAGHSAGLWLQADGGVVAISSSAAGARIWRTDSKGVVLSNKTVAADNGGSYVPVAATPLADGTLVLGAVAVGKTWLVRTSLAGTALWHHYGTAEGVVGRALVAVNGELLWLSDRGPKGGVRVGEAERLTVDGAKRWVAQLNVTGATAVSVSSGVAMNGGGGALIAGGSLNSKGWRGALWSVDGKGLARWQRNLAMVAEVSALTATSTGARAFAVDAPAGESAAAVVLGLDNSGNVAFQRGLAVAGDVRVAGAIAVGDGAAVLLGTTASAPNQPTQGLFARVDAFGNDSCAASGLCGGKTALACDDGKACTADGCTAKTGCNHSAAGGFDCDPDGGCALSGKCQDGACKPSDDGLLWTRSIDDIAEAVQVDAVASLSDGGYAIAGTTTGSDSFVARLSPSGATSWSKVFDDAAAAPALAATADGGVIVAQVAVPYQKGALLRVRKLSAAGELLWTFPADAKDKVAGTAGDVIATADGGSTAIAYFQGKYELLRLNASGAKVWLINHNYSTLVSAPPPRLLSRSDGGVVVAHTSDGGSKVPYPRVTRSNPLGVVAWTFAQTALVEHRVHGVVALAGENIVVAGAVELPDGDAIPWLHAVDGGGKKLWQRYETSPLVPSVAAALPGGGAVWFGGAKDALGTGLLRLLRSEEVGGGIGSIVEIQPPGLVLTPGFGRPLAVLSDGGLLVGGNSNDGKTQHPFVARVDRFGAASCAASGNCAALAAKGCDDGDPCTLDGCDAKVGKCDHTPAGDGFICGVAKTCLAKVCVAVVDELVLIPGGTAFEGCNPTLDAKCNGDELPQRETAAKTFWLDRYEATREQYKACVKAGKCPPMVVQSFCNQKLGDEAAINCVTHAAATKYCAYRGMRLPTEAEWEKAARGGCDAIAGDCKSGGRTFVWGEDAASCDWTIKQTTATGGAGCGINTPLAPGSRFGDLSPYGIFDLAGNVSEWTSDFYGKDTFKTTWADAPGGPDSGSGRVAKGGNFQSYLNNEVRIAARLDWLPLANHNGAGVRCAKDVD